MLKRHFSLTLILIMLATIVVPAAAQTQNSTVAPTGGLTVPVTGQARGAGRLTGTFTVLQFVPLATAPSGIGATGKLVMTTANGRMFATTITMPVAAAAGGATGGGTGGPSIQAVCGVLDLTLGPLDLDLLGLVIHLDTVHLTIDADPAGGLLGQLLSGLLCNLLGNLGNIGQLITLLNQLLVLLNSF